MVAHLRELLCTQDGVCGVCGGSDSAVVACFIGEEILRSNPGPRCHLVIVDGFLECQVCWCSGNKFEDSDACRFPVALSICWESFQLHSFTPLAQRADIAPTLHLWAVVEID